MKKGEDYPRYETVRRSLRLDKPIDDYIDKNTNNLSGFINRILWDALGGEIPHEGPEYEAPDVRRRLFRLQLEALRKERHQIEMFENRIEGALEDMETLDKNTWEYRLDRAISSSDYQGWRRYESLDGSDPDREDE